MTCMDRFKKINKSNFDSLQLHQLIGYLLCPLLIPSQVMAVLHYGIKD